MISCLGEALIDLMPADDTGVLWHARAGGAPMNVAVAAGRLGAPVRFVGHLSTDRFGGLLRRHLDDAGVATDRCAITDAPTTLAVVDPGGATTEPSFGFHAAGTTAVSLPEPDVDLADGSILHLSGSVSAVLEPAADAFASILARHRHQLVTIDPNPRPAIIGTPEAFRGHLDVWLRAADLVKVSRADLHWIDPDRDASTIARSWLDDGVTAVVVTCGGDGAVVHTADAEVAVAAPTARVVDTVGAGDSFMGGLLTMLHERHIADATGLAALGAADWQDILGFAGRVAAIACERVGADPPRRSEL